VRVSTPSFASLNPQAFRSMCGWIFISKRALESVLTQKGYIEPAALDLLIETYEKKIGPHNGPELSPRRGSMRSLSGGWRWNRRPQLLRLATPVSREST